MMPEAQTSFSAGSWRLSRSHAVTSNLPEVLFDINDQCARHLGSDHSTFPLALHTDGRILGNVGHAERTLQDRYELRRPISVESVDVAGSVVAYFLEAKFPVVGDPQDEIGTCIDTIPAPYEDRYGLRRPIPVKFEDVAADAVVAHFPEADLAVTGSDRQDAKASLALWILDIFDDLAAANPQELGQTPALQIRVLSEYLSRRP